MFKELKERFSSKDIADPVFLNFCIFTSTYVLSIISCLVPWGVGDAEGYFGDQFIGALIECVMPTTATLILSSIFQNFSVMGQNAITKCHLTLWIILLDGIYMMLYPIVKLHIENIWFKIATAIFTGALLILCLLSIAEVERNRVEVNSKKGKHERSLIRK